METIIENGKRMEGIPYPVAVWDAKSGMWDDSIEELGAVYANSEDEAIDCAIEYVKDSIIMYGTEDEDEQAEQIAYYSDPNAYRVETEKSCIYSCLRNAITKETGRFFCIRT